MIDASIASMAREIATRMVGLRVDPMEPMAPTVDECRDAIRGLAVLLGELAEIVGRWRVITAVQSAAPSPDAALLTIRRAVESCSELCLDDESDRELLIGRLARGLGVL